MNTNGLLTTGLLDGCMMSNLQDLHKLSATNRLPQMKANLSNSNYIIKDMAIEGQITLFYAKPNTGKTLLFLHFFIEAISEGRLDPDDLFYINADDNYNGLFTKANIAQQHGFHMISPSEAQTSCEHILCLLHELGQNKLLKNKVIVLDTLKKFVDMMAKRQQSKFFDILRDIGMAGATVIIAGHANKHLDDDRNLVYEGTGDVLSDIDCAYSINKMSEHDDHAQVVEFRNEKDRGTVAQRVSYQYSKTPGCSYADLINSVTMLSNAQASNAAAMSQQSNLTAQYASEIAFITQLLQQGSKDQSQILAALKVSTDPIKPSKRKVVAALKGLNGTEWVCAKGVNNKSIYSLPP